MDKISRNEITPEWLYMNRRQFLQKVSLVGGAAFLAACAPGVIPTAQEEAVIQDMAKFEDTLTDYEAITGYNNYYEFSLSKEGVAPAAKNFKTDPWQVEVYGLVNNPITFSMQDILDQFPQEERIYRLRCVEGWSMVIPWTGFSLSKLLDVVQPTQEARFVRFQTLMDFDQMPGLGANFPWPYQEGLRLDEAQNELTILATGIYDKPLTPQNGAPIRLVVPWKYGFKSAKSLVKIELVAEQPGTFWNSTASNEYGFYSNVNPEVSHPRWLQDTERRIGELQRRPTFKFNGYEAEVGYLYEGMDLKANY
ncbi:MAG: protein-methionine-sulfoxide reductase catalytic subunit MsrP [Chloroflexi bacterium HGW-Chloroflexi-10]|nr:MAG: protein-methionine-sulfoxide reductase catalytic subunit MsrP [Chloroflexi bacterium HGW-Chloroflexi-10]